MAKLGSDVDKHYNLHLAVVSKRRGIFRDFRVILGAVLEVVSARPKAFARTSKQFREGRVATEVDQEIVAVVVLANV